MPQRKKIKKQNSDKKVLHIYEIPKSYFPRRSNAKEYAYDLMYTVEGLDYINRKIQYSAQLCTFNIKSITQKSGFKPKPKDVLEEINEFIYHYENFCSRLYVFREKLIQFINAIIPLGYTDDEIRLRDILVSPLVRQIGLLPLVEQFKNDTYLSKAINDRKRMTHRIYYGKEFDHYLRPQKYPTPNKKEEIKRWFNEWKKHVVSRALIAGKCRDNLDEIQHSLTQKIVAYKK